MSENSNPCASKDVPASASTEKGQKRKKFQDVDDDDAETLAAQMQELSFKSSKVAALTASMQGLSISDCTCVRDIDDRVIRRIDSMNAIAASLVSTPNTLLLASEPAATQPSMPSTSSQTTSLTKPPSPRSIYRSINLKQEKLKRIMLPNSVKSPSPDIFWEFQIQQITTILILLKTILNDLKQEKNRRSFQANWRLFRDAITRVEDDFGEYKRSVQEQVAKGKKRKLNQSKKEK